MGPEKIKRDKIDTDTCEHDWVSAQYRNIRSGSFCTKCFMVDPRSPEFMRRNCKVD